MDNFNFNFENIQCKNVQFGSGNVMVNVNTDQERKAQRQAYECKGCAAINKIDNLKCEYCGRVKE